MIQPFRKIRKTLFADGKTNKYLLYAIGEILLVVVGILIAVAINNWRQSVDRNHKERDLYRDLIEELKIDLEEIEGNRKYNQHYLSRYKRAGEIILIDKARKQADTLALIATELVFFSDFKNEESSYQKLTFSGKIDLISDNDILNALQNLGMLYTYINRIEENQSDYTYTLIPKITEYVRLEPLKVMQTEALYNYKFHNDIQLMVFIGNEKEGLYEQGEEDILELISLLKEELL